MKVLSFVLAFLIIVFSVVPFVMTSCRRDNNKASTNTVSVYNKDADKIIKMNIEEYLEGVVSAEMPAGFSDEALKAQAVAARTYALRKVNKSLPEHKGADLCTDFSHCQAYLEKEKLKINWGEKYKENIKKIKSAVDETRGEYLQYDNDFAITVFHSCSNGITEKASEVWGGDIPYLVNVESPGDYIKKDYITVAEFTQSEFMNIIKDKLENEVDFTKEAIGDIKYTSGSNVSEICIFGQNIKGTDIRKFFSLKSTSFSLEQKDDKFIFTVTGNGHGVGMSQYGAEQMGRNNISYKEILSHYYPGTILCNMYN